MAAGRQKLLPGGQSTDAGGCRPPPGPGAHGPPAAPAPPATRPGGGAGLNRSARRSRWRGWVGSSEHPPPAGGQSRLVARHCGLHAGGEEQGADRHPALQAGIHLARGLDPVRQLTGANERGREHDLAGEQAMGGGRAEQPQQWVHQARRGRVFWLLPRVSRSPVGFSARPHQLLAQAGEGLLVSEKSRQAHIPGHHRHRAALQLHRSGSKGKPIKEGDLQVLGPGLEPAAQAGTTHWQRGHQGSVVEGLGALLMLPTGMRNSRMRSRR